MRTAKYETFITQHQNDVFQFM